MSKGKNVIERTNKIGCMLSNEEDDRFFAIIVSTGKNQSEVQRLALDNLYKELGL